MPPHISQRIRPPAETRAAPPRLRPPAEMSEERIEELLHIADENQDDEIQFVEFANVAMQMEFDRDALDRRREDAL